MVVPTAHGDGLTGVWKGWHELYKLGYVDTTPKMVAAELNASLEPALQSRADRPAAAESPAPSDAPAFSINVPIATQQTLASIRRSSGTAVSVQSTNLITLQRQLAEDEGIYAEASSLASLAAVQRLVSEGAIRDDDVIVAVLYIDRASKIRPRRQPSCPTSRSLSRTSAKCRCRKTLA